MRKNVILLLGMVLLANFWPVSASPPTQVWAQAHGSQQRVRQDAETGHVTILILDMSGSMVDNDAEQIRCQAADAFIDLTGPGNEIGLVDLAGEEAQVWQEPAPTDAVSDRLALKQIIAHPPGDLPGCQDPSGNTPTASSLRLAWSMLNNTTTSQHLQGSAILLSDGTPYPDTSNQKDTIQKQIIPLFQQRHWPIDTIALGTQGVLRPFLQNIAQQTGGIAYDNAQGVIPGKASSLNILPFFTNILNQRVSSVSTTIASLTSIDGQVKKYNLTLGPDVKTLDVLLVRDAGEQSSVTARLISPGPASFTLPSAVPIPDTDTEQNPSYMSFSITGPGEGTWELDVQGSGQYEVSSLETSYLQIAFLSPLAVATPLNITNPLHVVAQVVDTRSPDVPLSRPGLLLAVILTYQGSPDNTGRSFTIQQYSMQGNSGSELYQTTIQLPGNTLDGIYTLTVISTKNTADVIAESTLTVHLVHFPVPVLNSGQVTSYQWPDPAGSTFHLPLLGSFYTWAFAGSSSWIVGKIQLGNASYTQAHLVRVIQIDSHGRQVSLAFFNTSLGAFQIAVPDESSGNYMLVLLLNGSFEGTVGTMGSTQLAVHLVRVPPTNEMWTGYAALDLLLFLLLLVLLLGIYLFATGPRPFGFCNGKNDLYTYAFAHVRRSRLGVWRNRLLSERVSAKKGDNTFYLPKGLYFRFSRGFLFLRKRSIKVRLHGPDGAYWAASLGAQEKKLSYWRYRKVSRLSHCIAIERAYALSPPKEYILSSGKNMQKN